MNNKHCLLTNDVETTSIWHNSPRFEDEIVDYWRIYLNKQMEVSVNIVKEIAALAFEK